MADTKRISFGPDHDLVEQIRRGNIDAFEHLYKAHHDGLIAFVGRYMRSWDESAEVVQDIFLRLWEKRNTWIVRTTVQSYLYGAARNTALNAVQHRRVVEESEWVASWKDTGDVVDQSTLEDDEQRILVARELLNLSERQRAAIALRYQGLTYEEVGDALDISHVAARKLVLAGEERLRKALR